MGVVRFENVQELIMIITGFESCRSYQINYARNSQKSNKLCIYE